MKLLNPLSFLRFCNTSLIHKQATLTQRGNYTMYEFKGNSFTEGHDMLQFILLTDFYSI